MADFLPSPKLAYDPKRDDWLYFKKTFSNYLTSVQPEERLLLPLLETALGKDGWIIFNGLPTPKDTYEEAVQRLNEHFDGTCVLRNRSRFLKARQAPDESIQEFACRLQRLSSNCQFKNDSEMLRDLFVVGVMDERLAGQLLEEKASCLTFELAVRKAMSMERYATEASIEQVDTGRSGLQNGSHRNECITLSEGCSSQVRSKNAKDVDIFPLHHVLAEEPSKTQEAPDSTSDQDTKHPAERCPSKSVEEEGDHLELQTECYDGVFVFVDDDRERALRDMSLLLSDDRMVLKNGLHPKIVKRYDLIGQCSESTHDFITWFERALRVSTFVLVYASKNFFSSTFGTKIQSFIMHYSFETPGVVDKKIGNVDNVIPIRPEEDGPVILKMPLTQAGFSMEDLHHYGDTFRQNFVATFNSRLHVREARERDIAEKIRSLGITSTESVGQIGDYLGNAVSQQIAGGPTDAPVTASNSDSRNPTGPPQQRKKKRAPFVSDPSMIHLP